MLSVEQILLLSGLLLMLGVLSSRISSRFGVPALVLFLVLGMLAGSEGFGGIHFDDPNLAQFIGVLSLVLILFSGGMDTEWKVIKSSWVPALSLATLGVLITAVLVGWFCVWVLKFSLLQGILLGSIISSTDAAAVFSTLRDKNVRLRKDTASLLEVESATNDPMAVFLTVSTIQLLSQGWGEIDRVVISFFWQMGSGLFLGWGLGKIAGRILSQINLPSAGLFPVFTTAIAFFSYGFTSFLGGSGFLAVYVTGLILANSEIQFKTTLVRFHEGMAWMAQIIMFVTLGLLVFPSELLPVMIPSLGISLCLIVLARPLAVLVSVFWTKLELRVLALVSWVGLRGAVPIILATYPLVAGIENSQIIFNIVFFVVLTSSLIQGTSISWVADKLGLSREIEKPLPIIPWQLEPHLGTEILQFNIGKNSRLAGKKLEDLHLPENSGISLILRANRVLAPQKAETVEPGDVIFVLAGQEDMPLIAEIFTE